MFVSRISRPFNPPSNTHLSNSPLPAQDERYNTGTGRYEPHCGLGALTLAWGHDEYLYQVRLGGWWLVAVVGGWVDGEKTTGGSRWLVVGKGRRAVDSGRIKRRRGNPKLPGSASWLPHRSHLPSILSARVQVLSHHEACAIPDDGLMMVRYHSFYPWHTGIAKPESACGADVCRRLC